jgi:transposase
VINPSDTSHIRRKTDKLDARRLAQHSLHGIWRESWIATDLVQELRVLVIFRSKLVSERTRLTNRINSDLLRFGHTVGQLGNIAGSSTRPLVEDFMTHDRVLTQKEYFGAGKLPEGVKDVIRSRYGRIDAINEEVAAFEKRALQVAREAEWPIGGGELVKGDRLLTAIATVPGVGTWTALTWLAEVGDVNRFSRPEKLLAYAGLDPTSDISADKVVRIKVRKGNARLHYALRHAAQVMLSRRPMDKLSVWARAYMARQVRGGKGKACSALARKLAKCLFACHSRCVHFDDSMYGDVIREDEYPNIPVDEMGLSDRVVKVLKGHGLLTSREVVSAFLSDLGRRPGCGKATVKAVADWVAQFSKKNRPQRGTQTTETTEALTTGARSPTT